MPPANNDDPQPSTSDHIPDQFDPHASAPNWPSLMVEGIEAALFSLDHHWRFTYINSYAAKLWDRSKESLLGAVMWEEFPSLTGTNFEKFFRQIVQENRPGQLEEFSPSIKSWYEVRAYPTSEGLIVYLQDITARKQLENSLKESEERYRALSEASYEGLIIFSQGKIVEVNQRMAELFGYSLEEFVQTSFQNLIAPEALPAMQQRIAANSTAPFETICLRKDGTPFFCETRGRMIEYRGQPARAIAGRDLTAIKQAQQELEESKERYKFLSDATTEAVLAFRDGTIIEASQSAARIYGYDNPQQMIGRVIADIVTPQSLEEVQRRVAEDYAKPFEIVAAKKDGTAFQAEVWGKTVLYLGQRVRVVTSRDITERKQQIELLRQSEERYRLLVENIEDYAIFMVDTQGKVSSWNRGAQKIKGYPAHEIIGQSIEKFYTAEDLAQDLPAHILETARANGRYQGEGWRVRRDGSLFWASVVVTALYHEQSGELRGYSKITRDITNRKRQEQALKESEERFKFLSDATSEGVLAHYDGLIIEANQSAAYLCGYTSPAELIGTPITRLVVPRYLDPVQGRIDQTYHDAFEAVVHKKDGTHLAAEGQVKTLEYRGQTVRVGTLRDITERKQFEQQLRESEERYRILSEASYEGLVIFSHGKILDANQRLASMLGYTLDEFIQMPVENLVTPEVRAALRERLATNNTAPVETIGLRKDGTTLFLETRGSMIEYQGHPTRVIAVRDLTEIKESERQLRDSEERYRMLSEASYEGLLIFSNGKVVEANRRMAEIFGYSLEEFIGIAAEKIVAPEVLATVQQRIASAATDSTELIGLRKNGTTFPYESRGRIIEYLGQPARLMTVRDLAEIKQAEEALRKTQLQLFQSQKMESIGRLAGGIAHDFNNLLSAIIGYSEFALRNVKAEEPLHEYLSEIMKAGERAADLTRQLLAFSRQQVLQSRVINLNEIVDDMNKLLYRLIGEDIELLFLADPQLAEVLADPGQFEQIVVNLAVNARDAMPDGGKLTIETANVELDEQYHSAGHSHVKTGSYVMLAVSDTGTGMDQATMQKIFEPFFTTKEVGRGTGLGLATVFGIVEQSEGYIFVYSELGIGTTFKIYLPRHKALPMIKNSQSPSHQSASQPTSHSLPPNQLALAKARTILIVEDDKTIRNLIQQVLTEAGYNILVATNGQQALDLLTGQPITVDLVLTDIIMPKMSGRELVQHLKARWPNLQIICMSGYTDQTIVRHELIQQCDNFLQKPFTPAVLLNLIQTLLKT